MALVASAAGAFGAWEYAKLDIWEPAFPGILVAVAMLGAAVLVRLARNVPITAPATFDDEDFKLFFDTLEALAHRLFVIFVQVLVCITCVISSIIIRNQIKNAPNSQFLQYESYFSAALAFSILWLFFRLIQVARGDIGFVRLQRKILSNSMMREKRKNIKKIVEDVVQSRSGEDYGRALKVLD